MQLSGSLGQSVAYRGYWDCMRQMAHKDGVRSFYRGFTVSCVKTAPAAAIQVSCLRPSCPDSQDAHSPAHGV
jgi:hypothetical protein